ncbi:MAG: hypothetical protein KW802_03135 [Candidatus Doudnabacteria bacterium]|nr:hypothetical protein [Candidatus Doudnabacteria bacterium]
MIKNNPISVRNEQEEYTQIRGDLVFVVIMNLVFLAILLGLYFFNQANGRVDQFFAQLLKF